jgi:predicted CopG family antitoxin
MAVKTITIDMEAYNILNNEKKKGESFSQVIKRRLKKTSTAKNLLDNIEKYSLSDECLEKIDIVIKKRNDSIINSEVIG